MKQPFTRDSECGVGGPGFKSQWEGDFFKWELKFHSLSPWLSLSCSSLADAVLQRTTIDRVYLTLQNRWKTNYQFRCWYVSHLKICTVLQTVQTIPDIPKILISYINTFFCKICLIFFCFFILSAFWHEKKCWKLKFWPAFEVRITQILAKIYNKHWIPIKCGVRKYLHRLITHVYSPLSGLDFKILHLCMLTSKNCFI